ncbi:MAG: NAD-dependent epimerase/dehydratase family protein [Demequinaceae bacterium]|nr:NAD-dependent epimerase/dehydratase family protein [Demequinaceae bacterium]
MAKLGAVLVTGGAGFIGCALSQQVGGDFDRWVALDVLHPQVHPSQDRPADLADAAELIVGDVTDPDVWDRVLAEVRPDVVVHLAAETGTAQSLDEATRHASVNVVGTTQMLDAFGRHGHVPSHVVLSSSRAVYGEGMWRRADGSLFAPGMRSHAQFERSEWGFGGATPVPSEASITVPAPTSVYGATKLAQEHILAAWAGSHDVPLSVLRFQNVYGPGQSLINPYTGIVSMFSQWAKDGQSIPIYEDGLITRDFVFIDDVARSIAAAIDQPPAADTRRRLDIGFGVGSTILELAEVIAAYYDAPAPHINGKYRDGDIRHAECDITAAKRELGWVPQVDLTEGVSRLQDWIAAQHA